MRNRVNQISDNKQTTMYNESMRIRCLGGLLTLALVLHSCRAKCPTRSEVLPLDLNQFSGEWFVVAGTPVSGKSLSKCGRFSVTRLTADTFAMNYTAVSHRRNNPVAFFVSARLDDDVTGNWQLQGSNRILGPFKHRVVAVEYDSYFAMIVCGENNPDLPAHEFSMIWSRTRTLGPATVATLKDKVALYLKRDTIRDVRHTNC